jgi:hypothetical protein
MKTPKGTVTPRGNDKQRGFLTPRQEQKIADDILTLSDRVERMNVLKKRNALDKNEIETLKHLKNSLDKKLNKEHQRQSQRDRRQPDRYGV